MLKKAKKLIIPFICILLVITMSTVFIVSADAPDGWINFDMSNGGSWVYNGGMDSGVVRTWSEAQWRSVLMVQSVYFYSPEQVQTEANLLGAEIGMDLQHEAIKEAVNWAVDYGIDRAKELLIENFGASLATDLIPFLDAASWTYTAVVVIESIAKGQQLYRYADAASKGKGLIFVSQRNTGDASFCCYWDGSSRYGSYPNAKLGPNNWQYGDVTIN